VLVTALLVLVVANLLNNVLAPTASLLTSPAAAVLLLAIARHGGYSWSDLGLSGSRVLAGLAWGGAGAAAVTLVYAVGLAVPPVRAAAEPSPGAGPAAFKALVDVPLSTVALEEIGFRGVLWAMIERGHGPWTATAVSSVLFGFWHVLPSLRNSAGVKVPASMSRGLGPRSLWVALNVAVTAVAGVGFCLLRRVSGSLLAPICVHWALNGVGFAFRVAADRTRPPAPPQPT